MQGSLWKLVFARFLANSAKLAFFVGPAVAFGRMNLQRTLTGTADDKVYNLPCEPCVRKVPCEPCEAWDLCRSIVGTNEVAQSCPGPPTTNLTFFFANLLVLATVQRLRFDVRKFLCELIWICIWTRIVATKFANLFANSAATARILATKFANLFANLAAIVYLQGSLPLSSQIRLRTELQLYISKDLCKQGYQSNF